MSAIVNTLNQNHNVFVYGSLLADEVVRTVLNRVPQSASATLSDYHRFKIKHRIYPAISPVQTKKVTGRVLLGLSGTELHLLDEFEDVQYNRTEVEVLFTDNSENFRAYAYVWAKPNDPDLYSEWDFEEWKETHMNDFMADEFMHQLEMPETKARVQENDKPLHP